MKTVMESKEIADKIITSLKFNVVLHVTSKGNEYRFLGLASNKGIKYSIKENSKTLPYKTLVAAISDSVKGIDINTVWYREYNEREHKSRPCNLSVLKGLIRRVKVNC